MLYLIGIAVCGSCRKICDNWDSLEFFTSSIGDMLADGFHIASKQYGHLLPIHPHSFTFGINTDLQNNVSGCRLVKLNSVQFVCPSREHALFQCYAVRRKSPWLDQSDYTIWHSTVFGLNHRMETPGLSV